MQDKAKTHRALALVGMTGSGKTLCAAHLEAKGYPQYRFGKIVVDEVINRGLPVTPLNERAVREEFRAKEGMNAIARRALPHLQAALEKNYALVIDGLYGFGEYKMLHDELPGALIVVAIVSPRNLRYERLSRRPERPLTAEEAERRDFREIETLEKGGPIAIADYTLVNNQGKEMLLASLDALIAELDFYP